jgi:CRISPR-associated protein Cas5d
MYTVNFEIEGPNAMFTDPASGSTPTSYPAPTWSSLKAMFEAVARDQQAYIRPTHIEICRPIRFERFTTNYGGPLRKTEQIRENNNLQLVATILVDVCYRVYGVTESIGAMDAINHAHALQGIFTRRLKQGTRLFYTPSLGWKEFIPTYFGPLRKDSQRDETVSFMLPSMLKSAFDAPVAGRYAPVYLVDVRAEKGVLYYDGKPGGRYAG